MDKQAEKKELGFGSGYFNKIDRYLNRDGTFNTVRTGESAIRNFDLYHWLISCSWKKFIFLVLFAYTITNILFGILYIIIGVEHLTGIDQTSNLTKLLDAFYFSSQTLTTLGYGRIAPTGIATSVVAAIEGLIGLMFFALVTGILYGRFSRPKAKIQFSSHAVIAPHKNGNAFMFRIVNKRKSQLLERK